MRRRLFLFSTEFVKGEVDKFGCREDLCVSSSHVMWWPIEEPNVTAIVCL